ncbi:hypothetical protein BHE74_00029853, partial [Ensete ventricosum]
TKKEGREKRSTELRIHIRSPFVIDLRAPEAITFLHGCKRLDHPDRQRSGFRLLSLRHRD